MFKRLSSAFGYSLIIWFVLWVLFYGIAGSITWIVTDEFEVYHTYIKLCAWLSGVLAAPSGFIIFLLFHVPSERQ